MSNRKQYLLEQEAAEILCLSIRTLRQWRWKRQGPRFTKLGNSTRGKGRVLYDYDDIVAFLDAHKVKML